MFRPAKTAKSTGFLSFLLVFATAAMLAGCGSSSGSHSSPAASGWHLLPEAPSAIAAGRTSVWTGTEMIISGTNPGADGTFIRSVEVAEAYNPATREWRKLASPPKTESFCHRDAVWTGKEMLVWGCDFVAFNPKANEWRRLPVPLTREGIVVWTGRELIGWGGGCCGDADSDGSAYNPATNTWRKLARSPLAPSQSPTGAWTGKELIMFVSGLDPEGKPVKGAARAAAYNPATDTWRRIAPLPTPDQGTNAVWDGQEILVAATGLAYNPTTDRSRAMAPIASGRGTQALAVWTGRQLLLWGGEQARPEGLAYDPQADRWSPLPKSPLVERLDPAGVWTGRELIVWGGVIGTPVGTSIPAKYLADGAAFRPNDTGDRSTAAARARPTSRTRPRQLIAQRPSTSLPACC